MLFRYAVTGSIPYVYTYVCIASIYSLSRSYIVLGWIATIR